MKRKIPTRVYAEALYECVRDAGDDRGAIRSLAAALVRNVVQHGGRTLLPEIIRAFSRAADEKEGRVCVQLTTSRDYEPTLPQTLGGREAYVESVLDSSLLGGVRLRIADTLVDNSLKARIGRLRTLF